MGNRMVKIQKSDSSNPYCQGIRWIRIRIPGNSANIRRGILRYLQNTLGTPIFVPWLQGQILLSGFLFDS